MSIKIIAQNKKARFEYFILDTYEAGIVLTGTEVKSARLGKVNLKDSFGRIENGELYVFNMHISPYPFGNRANHDPTRTRKLLLHKKEINRLIGKTKEKGLTLVPLKIYFSKGKCKIEMALAKGKKLFDKRESIKTRDTKLEIQRALKHKR
jgi:SsrA-binding protein